MKICEKIKGKYIRDCYDRETYSIRQRIMKVTKNEYLQLVYRFNYKQEFLVEILTIYKENKNRDVILASYKIKESKI